MKKAHGHEQRVMLMMMVIISVLIQPQTSRVHSLVSASALIALDQVLSTSLSLSTMEGLRGS